MPAVSAIPGAWILEILKILVIFGGLLQVTPVLVYVERKVCAFIQDRVGPNRVGPFGLLQPVADAIKLIFKEDILPDRADRVLYTVAPLLVLAPAVTTFALIPLGHAVTVHPHHLRILAIVAAAGLGAAAAGALGLGVWARSRGPGLAWLFPPAGAAAAGLAAVAVAAALGLRALADALPAGGAILALQVSDFPAGILFFLAVGSIGVYGIAFGGWASNNKFSLLGSLRASAQVISYEITLGLSLILVLMATSPGPDGVGTVRISEIVARQGGCAWILPVGWNVFHQPLAFLLFLIAAFAETNRLPFDLSECEPELVGGYHTEYSSMKFGMFFMGEYLSMVTMSSMLVTLFLGGWNIPGIDPGSLGLLSGAVSVAAFAAKVGAVLFLFIWVRWSIPRFKYDQLMRLGWKVLVPAAVVNVVVSAALAVL